MKKKKNHKLFQRNYSKEFASDRRRDNFGNIACMSPRDEIFEYANRIIESRDLSALSVTIARKMADIYGVWKFHLYRTTAPIGETNVAEPVSRQ